MHYDIKHLKFYLFSGDILSDLSCDLLGLYCFDVLLEAYDQF